MEIPPLIRLSTNWYFSISKISFKLTLVNVSITSQLDPTVVFIGQVLIGQDPSIHRQKILFFLGISNTLALHSLKLIFSLNLSRNFFVNCLKNERYL